jgi:sporulation protein YlmC with PRC-barrel domain
MEFTRDPDSVSAPPGRHDNGTTRVIVSASRMIGNEVFNRKEKSIGNIREFILSGETGSPHYVVVSSGGFFGFGERLHAVPWNALSLDTENQWFMLNVDAENLSDAPAFDRHNWPEITNTEWMGQTGRPAGPDA